MLRLFTNKRKALVLLPASSPVRAELLIPRQGLKVLFLKVEFGCWLRPLNNHGPSILKGWAALNIHPWFRSQGGAKLWLGVRTPYDPSHIVLNVAVLFLIRSAAKG